MKPPLSKKALFTVIFLLIILLPVSTQTAGSKVVLNFWEFSVGEELMRSLLDKFQKQNPEIEVKLQQLSWDYGFDKIVLSVAANNAPDICELGTDWVPKFSSSGVLLDITDQMADIKDKYLLWDPVIYDNRIYGAPWLAGTRVLFYNRDLFFKAGLDPDKPPQTWDELLFAAKKIKELAADTYGFGIFAAEPYAPWQEFLPFAWSNSGDVLSSDMSASVLNSPAVVEAMEFYQRLKPYSMVDRQPQINMLFAKGRVGMQISGFWNFTLIPRQNPALNFAVALLPKPSNAKGFSAAFAGGEIFVVLKNSKHPKEAVKLIKFLMEEENTLEIVKVQHNVVPTYKASINHPYYQTHPNERIFFQQMLTAVAPPNHPNWVAIQEEVTAAIENVVVGHMDPKKALNQASSRIDEILREEVLRERFSDKFVTIIICAVLAALMILFYLRKKIKGIKPAYRFSLAKDKSTLVFLCPWLATFLVFGVYPLIYSIVISLSRYNLLNSQMAFVGFRNFLEVLQDPAFRRSVLQTVYFAVGTIPFTMIIALFAAVLINQKVPLKQVYQAGFFLPVATSVIVIATIFAYLYAPEGLFNFVLDKLHIKHPEPTWLMNTRWALPSIMFMNIWASFGYYMVLFLAGLQTIPESLYEAASIDGANDWQKFIKVTLPQLRPIILFAVVINTINTLQVFPEIFAMTQGGPLGSTTTIVYYLYEVGFHRFQMGNAAAVGYLLFFMILGFSLLQMKWLKMGEQIGE
jgi:ABC-type sugar transport system permease subunit/ABC-type glycerol-3-phosphate transport system substrate-binding protein